VDLSFSKSDLAFRDEVRAFVADKYDEDLRKKNAQSKNGYLDKAGMLKWQKALYERGWVAPHWPTEYGGPGWSSNQKYIFDLEMSAAGTPLTSPMGLRMVAPVIMAFGTDAQKKKHLPPILSSDVWWCQGYSEPGSGSDLASLQMKCEDKGRMRSGRTGCSIWCARRTPGSRKKGSASFWSI
jgi:alkylation response protein AidB-like acyl-CoA dehydrogenase